MQHQITNATNQPTGTTTRPETNRPVRTAKLRLQSILAPTAKHNIRTISGSTRWNKKNLPCAANDQNTNLELSHETRNKPPPLWYGKQSKQKRGTNRQFTQPTCKHVGTAPRLASSGPQLSAGKLRVAWPRKAYSLHADAGAKSWSATGNGGAGTSKIALRVVGGAEVHYSRLSFALIDER